MAPRPKTRRDTADLGDVRKQFIIEVGSKALDDEARTVQFTITTEDVDRDNDIVSASGWDVANYMKNPIVLWAHDYSQPPVARALDLTKTARGLQSTAQFPAKGIYPFADMVFEMLKGGFLNATSVGFRPLEYSRDEERGGLNFQRQELLEFSIVPVPANGNALVVARSKGIDVDPLVGWAKAVIERNAAKGVSPKDVSLTKAPDDEKWSAPSLTDLLGDTTWGDATAAQKKKVAGHFAWAAEVPPATFGDLKLPHHNAKGSVVWAGVAAAAARLNQASIPSADMGAVRAHLARHYKQFGKTPPWEEQADAAALETQKRVKQQADADLAAALACVDGFIDAADSAIDALMVRMGVSDVPINQDVDDDYGDDPDDTTDALAEGRPLPMAPPMRAQRREMRKRIAVLRGQMAFLQLQAKELGEGADTDQSDAGDEIGTTLTEPAVVPAPGTAADNQSLCPACGAQYDGSKCTACGWQSPASVPGADDEGADHPMTQPFQQSLSALSQIRAIVKRGRVLSAANEAKIRAAKDHLDAVLAALNKPPEEDEADDGKAVVLDLDAAAEAAVDAEVIEIVADSAADEAAFGRLLRDACASSLADLVRTETQTALAQARGRVD